MQEITQMLHLKTVHHYQHVKQINGVFVNKADHIYIAMPMYGLIEYNNDYSDTSGSLWQFEKR